MTARELDAAGIHEPGLRAAYTRCRDLNARHGKTYFLATRLLPIDRRAAVHALYGFARRADDIVDDLESTATTEERTAALAALEAQLACGLRDGRATEPVIRALADTAGRYGIDHRYFADFLASMRSDLTVTGYASLDDLGGYMHGSAAVIGLQMLPVLGTVVRREEAAGPAAALGIAFQLTNFLRDVGEDLDRGRLYLPADLIAAHGVDRARLEWSRRTGARDTRITAALRAFAAHTRTVYRQALPGLGMLDPVARPCIRTAFVLYSGILDAIEAEDYAVLHRRAVVPRRRRAVVALDGLARALAARAPVRHRTEPAPGRRPATLARTVVTGIATPVRGEAA
ncbi:MULTISPECIES: phytoene/squalene synthase family protein [Streptomyces]|uniref:phytoene/squalene synthase family protein n=1 Tax=Streptomyces TaxID=1883 RepID=UPI0029A9388A|nr:MULTISPECIES: phytoene/squalene synthase family protein [unclassified Streptomyces]MDX3607464.1 phytoene/squalene synthase family protein [Streptomyces sp. FL06-04B]MDX3736502.1 phytoene/squalene synthase family protein [Streptomyces sp. ID01-15D]